MDMFFALGGKMLLCAPCAEYYCGLGSIQGQPNIFSEAEIAGLATVVSAATGDCQLVTF
jgi:hypothetical protein